MSAPAHARYVVIGAGIHGLSTAWHLAAELEARGAGSGADIVVLDKTGVGAGASGIACGTIRNDYFQPAMRELMAHNVAVWESDPDAFSYHPVGFLQAAPEAMHADVVQIYTQQQAIGYDSVLVEGDEACRAYMLALFPDWQAPGITTVLHEKQGGYASNRSSLDGLTAKARARGVQIQSGTRVTGLRPGRGSATSGRCSDCPAVSTSPTPPGRSTPAGPCGPTGRCRKERSRSIRARSRPVPAASRRWCTWIPAPRCTTTPTARSSPISCGESTSSRTSASAGSRAEPPSGGIGAFTPDSFPVFDTFRENVYVIADSNHGYKMIGVGALAARELLGEPQPLLEPFRFSRYRTGQLHPVSNSPFPWS